MSVFSYSDLCDALGPVGRGLASDPYIKPVITKMLAFQAESGLKKMLKVSVQNGNIKIKCDKKSFSLILVMISRWLGENWIPAEDVYYEILEYTNFSPSVTYQDFINKLKNMEAGVINFVEERKSSQDRRYFVKKEFVKRFISMEYRNVHIMACESAQSVQHFGSSVYGEIPGGNISFYKQDQESAVLPCAISQPLVFQNFMEVKHPYIRDMDKKETLDGLINTFIKRHQDLEKQQTVLEPNEKREAKIKSIIMDLVFVLKTQSEYIKKYFKQDIDVLAERYDSGNWMSISEIKSFFYPESLPEQIVAKSGGHIR